MDTNKEIEMLKEMLNDEVKLSAILQDGLETIVEVTGDDRYSGDTAIGIAQETLEAIAHFRKGNSKVASITNLRKILLKQLTDLTKQNKNEDD
jgi:DNA gyrase/topoisomerase IV subunit A